MKNEKMQLYAIVYLYCDTGEIYYSEDDELGDANVSLIKLSRKSELFAIFWNHFKIPYDLN